MKKKLLLHALYMVLGMLLFATNSQAQSTVYNITGGGSFCSADAGIDVGLDGSDAGVNYQLYISGTPVGGTVTGTGSALDFGLQATGGDYTIIGDPGTSNETDMNGTATVTVQTSPTAYNVLGGGNYCSGGTGIDVATDGSDGSVNYQLYVDGTAVGSATSGTGSSLDFGSQTTGGNYTVIATDATSGCTTTLNSSADVLIDPLPNTYNVTGGGNYCNGGAGVDVALDGSDGGVNYQVFIDGTATGGTISGIGSGLDLGYQTTGGNYTIVATDATYGCTSNMNGSASVTVNALPNVYNVNGGGNFCTGGTAPDITIDGSDAGINYQLYADGSAAGSSIPGTGSGLDMGTQSTSATYTVIATDATFGCTNNMNGGAVVNISTSPAVYNVTGGGNYCAGGTGVDVAIDGSDAGINYQLYADGTAAGSPITAGGGTLDIGLQTTAATYTIIGTDGTSGCATTMNGSSVVSINPLPVAYTISGGGNYCTGGTGVDVAFSGSDAGIYYQLYIDASPVGPQINGTGAAIDLGLQTTAGTYTAIATDAITNCVSNLSGAPVVTIISYPTVYNVIGGGTICSASNGADVALDGSDAGVTYQLYNGTFMAGSPVTGSGVSGADLGLQTTAGSYTVYAMDATATCGQNMAGSATVIVNPTPVAYTVEGGGGYCIGGAGEDINISGTDAGINYQLYNGTSAVGSTIPGTGATIDLGLLTDGGTYTMTATDGTTGCANTMLGAPVITVIPYPVVYAVTGGGSFCTGGSGADITLSGSDFNVTYQVSLSGSPLGTTLVGSGAALDLGLQTATGTYTVSATDLTNTCSNAMSGSASVSVNALPDVYNVTGGGDYCLGGRGSDVGLDGSSVGISYQLLVSGTATGVPMAGTNNPLDFSLQTIGGSYMVVATDMTTGCNNYMADSATVTIDNLPIAFSVTGGGSFCPGGTGIDIALNGSENDVNYQLYIDLSATGSSISGSGVSLDMGMQTTAGGYTVIATNGITGCTNNMLGTGSVTVYPAPTAYTMTGGGSYCPGSAGISVGLSNSDLGINYYLYKDGELASAAAGSGTSIDFGMQTTGTYTVVGNNTVTGCTGNMSGSSIVTLSTLPFAYNVTGGGSYCVGSGGEDIGLDGTASGLNYQLYNSGVITGTAITGTGAPLDFGFLTDAGTYTVLATDPATTCSGNMSGSANVIVNPALTAYTVTGGGAYCTGGTGVDIALRRSQVGDSYQLFNAGVAVGLPVIGTGAALDFGLQTIAGSYAIIGTDPVTFCKNSMDGNPIVTVTPLPAAYTVTGGGNYCVGGAGIAIGMDNTDVDVNYFLYNGTTPVGSVISGTGSAIDFGLQTTTGVYTIVGIDAIAGCNNNMTGSAVIGINPLPVAHSVTGGGNYCAGGIGLPVGLFSSVTGVNYQLYNGTSTFGGAVAGTGSAISFGIQTITGAYTAIATDAVTGCTNNMSGSKTIGVNALPAAYNVIGGGNFCIGTGGVSVGLDGSVPAVSYQLYIDGSATGAPFTGTGSILDFGFQTASGAYTISATDPATTCSAPMTGTAGVVATALPTAYAITGGGNYCPGTTGADIALSNSNTGINYQLYNGTTAIGTPVAGTGSILDMGMQTATGGYTIVANAAATTCSANMTGSVTVGISSLPAAYAVSGGGHYCASGSGIPVGLLGSVSGVNYQLYHAGTAVGSSLPGTGSPISFGAQLAAGAYTIQATSIATTCVANMTGTATINIDPLPVAQNVTGGGSYCAGGTGIAVGVDASEAGVNYQLDLSGAPLGGAMAGSGSALDLGLQTLAGSYTVVATNPTTYCTATMTGGAAISIKASPAVYTVSGGGTYCAGSAGEPVSLSSSESAGITYQLYLGTSATGTPLAGTGAPLSFGTHTTAGAYTVVATNTSNSCATTMSSRAVVNINPAPIAYNVTGGGNYCAGGAGVHVTLDGSASGFTYQLYNGTTAIGTPVAGYGAGLDLGVQTLAGSYTVVATNTATTCTGNMTGATTINIDPLPVVYNTTGAGSSYCAGGTGIDLSLAGSQLGVNYQLYYGVSPSGSPIPGTGIALDLGHQTLAGSYAVTAINAATGCTTRMTGTPMVNIDPVPTAYTVTGGGNYCSGGAGVHVSLSGSASGVTYQLLHTGTATGTPVVGTGGLIDLGLQSATGTYTIIAANTATGCTGNMIGAATVGVNPLPATYTVTGGGSYCASGTGVHIGQAGSTTGITYQLLNGTALTGVAVTGTGAAIDFGLETAAGTYTILATNAATTCASNMTGVATINVHSLPAVYAVTGGGNYCAGTTGVHVGMSSSALGINYQLYKDASATGSAVAGSGTAIDFGYETSAGAYTVVATDAVTGCNNNMTGGTTIAINPLPVAYTVTGGGTYCAGSGGLHIGLSSSDAGVSYQLYNSSLPAGSPVAGAGAIVDLGLQTVAGVYTITGTNAATGCHNAMTGSTVIAINPIVVPVVTIATGTGDTVCSGNLTTFTAMPVNGGTAPSYQWSVNGITAGSGNTYAYLPLDGDVIAVKLTSSALCATPGTAIHSMPLTVQTHQMPSVTIAADPGNVVCRNTIVTYTATAANGGSAPSYTWYKNNVASGIGATYSATPDNGDVVYCVLTSNYYCRIANTGTSTNMTMEVDVPSTPSVTITSDPAGPTQSGQPVTFTANATGGTGTPTYQWSVNNVAVIGGTAPTFTSDYLANGDVVLCDVTSGGGCSGLTGSAMLTVTILDNVGVKQVTSAASNIQIVPNPSKGTFAVKGTFASATDQDVTLEITDMLGQVIYTNKTTATHGTLDQKIQLGNNVANGMYLLTLHTNTENRVLHIVVEQ